MKMMKDKKAIAKLLILFFFLSVTISYILGGIDYIYVQCVFSRKWKLLLSIIVFILAIGCEIVIFFWDSHRKMASRENNKKIYITYNLCRFDIIFMFILTLIGVVLRYVGLNWGGGYIQQSDECLLVEPAITMAAEKTLYQRTDFYYPDQFISKIVSVIIRIFAATEDIEINMQMIDAYYIYRAVTAFFGVLLIVTAFLIGNQLKKHLGVLFAAFVAFYPEYVLLSKQVTGDITCLFFASLVILFSLKYMEEKREKWLFFMAMACAMATLEKWHGAGLCVYLAIVVIVFARSFLEVFVKGIKSFLFYFLWLLVLSPNMIFNLKSAIIDGFINIAVYEGGTGLPYYKMLELYWGHAFNWVGGFSYILLLGMGAVFLIKARNKKMIILLCGPIKVLILAFMNRGFIRWGLEFFFCMLFVAAYGFICLYDMPCKRKKVNAIVGISGGVIISVFLLELLLGSVFNMLVASANEQDTRYIQNIICSERGINRNNSYSEKYTAFWSCIEKGYYDPKFLVIQDGEVYRTDDNVKYFIDFADEYNEEIVSVFEANSSKILSIEGAYKDVFWRPVSNKKRSWNDASMISWYISAIEDVLDGACVGPTINIYDVSEYPTWSNEGQ